MIPRTIRLNLITPLIFFIYSIQFISCTQTDNYIIETDREKLVPDRTHGVTEEAAQKQSRMFFNEVIENTIGKEIPHLQITSISGQKTDLKDLLKGQTLLASSDVYCSWGLEGLTNDLPKAMELCVPQSNDLRVLCLIKVEEEDKTNPERLNKTIKELTYYYDTIYLVDEIDSRKLNLFANPTRLYINDDQIVTQMEFGVSTIERLCSEINGFIELTTSSPSENRHVLNKPAPEAR